MIRSIEAHAVVTALGRGLGVVALAASLTGCGLFGGSDSNQPLTTKSQTASGPAVQPIASGLSGDQQNAAYSDQQLTAQSEQASAPPPPVEVATISPPPSTTDNGSAATTDTAGATDTSSAAADTTASAATTEPAAATQTDTSAASTASAAPAPPPAEAPATQTATTETAASTTTATEVQPVAPAPVAPAAQTTTSDVAPMAPPPNPPAQPAQPVQVASAPAPDSSPVTVDESQIAGLQAAQPAPSYPAASAPAYSSSAPAYGATYAAAPGSLPPAGWPLAVVFFADGSTSLSDRAMGVLRDVVLLQQKMGGAIRVVGHASARTAAVVYGQHDEINQRLSVSRAQAVARALVRFGAAPGSISASGVGSQQPIYYEFMPTGEAGNRRVEVFLDGATTAMAAPVQVLPVAPPPQQVASASSSVTVDLSVLDQLGQPVAGQAVSPQLASIAANTYPSQGAGELLYPPLGNPVSMLTVPPPPELSPVVATLPKATSLAAAGEALQTKSNAAQTASASTVEAPAIPAGPAVASDNAASYASQAPATDLAASAGTSTGSETMPAAPPIPPAPGTQASASTDTGAGAAAAPAATQPATTAAADSGTVAPAPTTTDSSASATAAPAASGTSSGEATIASIGTQPTDSGGVTTSSDGGLHIAFPKDSAEIPDAAKSELDSLAQKLTADGNLRIELLAYASGTADTVNAARRTSLLRALAVRSYLVKHGVDGTRMDVRALGNKVEGTPADRVDVLPASS